MEIPLADYFNYGPEHRLLRHRESESAAWIALGACWAKPGDIQGEKDLKDFVALAASLRQKQTIVLDVRNNGGGNDSWGMAFLDKLYDCPPELAGSLAADPSATNQDLISAATTQAWMHLIEANAISNPNPALLQALFERVKRLAAEQKTKPSRYWIIPPRQDTQRPHGPAAFAGQIILLTKRYTASSGESFVRLLKVYDARHSQVGENTSGCLGFGNILTYSLPKSGIQLHLASSLFLYEDQRGSNPVDGLGYQADWWVTDQADLLRTLEGLSGQDLASLMPD